MALENGLRSKPIKILYRNWYEQNGLKSPLANALDPIFVDHIKKYIPTNLETFVRNGSREPELDVTFQRNNSGNMFRSGVFYQYVKEEFGDDIFINFDQVDEKNINILPIEVEMQGLNYITNGFSFSIDGINYDYDFRKIFKEDELKLLKQKKVYILLTNGIDPIPSGNQWKQFLSIISNLDIPIDRVIFKYGSIAKDYDPKIDKCRFVYDLISLRQHAEVKQYLPMRSDLGYISDYVRERDLLDHIRTRKFLCFNRALEHKHHRLGLLFWTVKYNLLDQGFFSFLNYNGNDLSEAVRFFIDDSILAKEEVDQIADRLADLLPLELDTKHLTSTQRSSFASWNVYKKEFYLDSYIHIVTETSYDNNTTAFISEKTWRPMMGLQPFISFAPWRTLATVRNLGFKTFSPFIDESYDEEIDPKKRFYMVLNEIKRLSEMDLIEIHRWYLSIKDILIHNQNNIDKYRNYFPYTNLWKLDL